MYRCIPIKVKYVSIVVLKAVLLYKRCDRFYPSIYLVLVFGTLSMYKNGESREAVLKHFVSKLFQTLNMIAAEKNAIVIFPMPLQTNNNNDVLNSVTTFGEILPLWQNFESFWAILGWFIQYLANFCTYFDIFMLRDKLASL